MKGWRVTSRGLSEQKDFQLTRALLLRYLSLLALFVPCKNCVALRHIRSPLDRYIGYSSWLPDAAVIHLWAGNTTKARQFSLIVSGVATCRRASQLDDAVVVVAALRAGEKAALSTTVVATAMQASLPARHSTVADTIDLPAVLCTRVYGCAHGRVCGGVYVSTARSGTIRHHVALQFHPISSWRDRHFCCKLVFQLINRIISAASFVWEVSEERVFWSKIMWYQ